LGEVVVQSVDVTLKTISVGDACDVLPASWWKMLNQCVGH
jgi:hypothetical protein